MGSAAGASSAISPAAVSPGALAPVAEAASGGPPVVHDGVAASVLGGDHHPAVWILALPFGAQVRVVRQRGVDDAALIRLHRLKPDALVVAFGAVGNPQRQF